MTQPVDLGTCWGCVTDLTMPAVMVSGFRCVAEAIARRWQTSRGDLIDDPNYGTDITDAVSDDLNKRDLSRLAHALGAEAEKDERVQTCTVTLTLQVNGDLQVTGKVKTATGPFQLVVKVDKVSVTLLEVTTQ